MSGKTPNRTDDTENRRYLSPRMGLSETELPVNRCTHRHAPWLACNIEQNRL